MRIAISFLFLCLPMCSLALTNKDPKQILTPEQIAIQEGRAELERLRLNATATYEAEAARENAGDCRNDLKTNLDQVMCLTREAETTDANYKSFTTALRAIIALRSDYDLFRNPTDPPRQPTPSAKIAAFDAGETAWRAYARAECNGVDVLWRGGTMVNSMVGMCHLRTTRARLHELNIAYDVILHPR